jgi:diguanylate cyclase (GGDEF)-like protein
VVVVSKLDDHVEAINTALRDSGHAVHCIKVHKLGELEHAIGHHNPELIVVFGNPDAATLKPVIDTRDACGPRIPVLQVASEINEDLIAAAMELGAHDVVSLNNIPRLQAVASRELRACGLANTLENVMNSANQFKNELHSLKQVSVEAIADIQEGIIVNANPSWLQLFDLPDDEDLTGLPIMDFCSDADRPALKGALVACQKGKWNDVSLNIKCMNTSGKAFSAAFSLEVVKHDNDPAVRMLVAPEKPAESSPLSMVEQAVQRDQVTGFFNQQHLLNVARQRLNKAPSGGVRAIAYIRPDRFSRAREDIGLIGTEVVISQLAQILREYMQPTDIYGRFGGTMFAVMLERGTMVDVETWAEQVLQTISETVFEHEGKSTTLTCSLGLCEVDSASAEIDRLLTDAEGACRTGRLKGGNCIELSESSGAAKKIRQDDTIWVPRIRGALMENRLRLEHQPIASLNMDIEGAFDTLVRMLDEEGNTVLPSEFMSVAERTGLSKNIDRWVIGASFSFCAANNAELIFVRLSRDSLLDESLLDWLLSHISETGISPGKICFEVSEELAAQHLRQTQELAEAMRTEGFLFAIEHFGKGNNSAQVINRIPMEFVKIDGSLMQGLHKNAGVQNDVKILARMAKDKGIRTIAERVQDANTMAVLWQLGVSYIQGNYVQNSEIIIEDTSQTSVTTRALALAEDAESESQAQA